MRKPSALLASAAAAGLIAALAAAAPAAASVTITQDSLRPASTVAGVSVSATLQVHSSACVTVQALTVAVRDSSGNNDDFPGAVDNARICPSGYTLTTGSRTFAAGAYTEFGAYELNGSWHNLTSQPLNVGAAGSVSAPSWDPGGSYSLTFDDEFNSAGVNTSVWEEGWYLGLGGTGTTSPVDSAMDNCYSSANVSQPGDGYLHLTLTDTASTCNGVQEPYTGALVDTRLSFSQASGAVEARVYLPATASGQVAGWPAWWMNGPDSVGWPAHGEIDQVEGLSGSTAAHLHYTDSNGDEGPGWTSAAPYAGWHNFGVAWSTATQTVTFYWDGQPVFSHAFTPGYPEYLIFDNSMSSASPQPSAWPSAMLVDWVRAWS
ncbi:MAG: family 16 glycosylhydrolase [Streptosporangiaceae bacterium]